MPVSKTEIASAEREAIWDLIPWYVNGTLEQGERRAVERQLAVDPALRAELAAQRQLADSVAALQALDVEMEVSLKAMRQRINSEASAVSWRDRSAAALRRFSSLLRPRFNLVLPLGAVAASLALIMVALPTTPPQEARYYTLTSPALPFAASQLRVKVAGEAQEERVLALFSTMALEVVEGPSSTGVYTLQSLGGGDPAAIAEALAAAPEIEFAGVRPGQ